MKKTRSALQNTLLFEIDGRVFSTTCSFGVGQAPRPAGRRPVGLVWSRGIGGFRKQPAGGPAADRGVRPTLDSWCVKTMLALGETACPTKTPCRTKPHVLVQYIAPRRVRVLKAACPPGRYADEED